MEGARLRVLYVLWAYPAPSEQFVSREVSGLARHGARIDVAVIGHDRADEPGSGSSHARIVMRVADLSRRRSLLLACRAVLARPSLCIRLVRHLWRTGRSEGSIGLTRVIQMALPALALVNVFRDGTPDLVHAHFANAPAVFASLLATLMQRPWGVSVHAHDLYAETIDLEARLAGASYILTCSQTAHADVRARLSNALRRRVLLVHHGVDVDQWQRPHGHVASGARLIVAIGRFQPKKGFEVLVDACAHLHASGLAFECELIGDGPLRDELQARIRERSLEKRISLVPWLSQDDLRRRLLDAEVLVVPSVVARDGDRDNIPNVLVEGLLLGLPIVASDLPAIHEVLAPQSAGLLVPPGEPSSLACAIRRLCEDRPLACGLRVNARRAALSRFDLRATSAQLFDVLDSARAGRISTAE